MSMAMAPNRSASWLQVLVLSSLAWLSLFPLAESRLTLLSSVSAPDVMNSSDEVFDPESYSIRRELDEVEVSPTPV
eukprot:328790-Pyramimonas_sp.AAC.3